MGRVRSPKRRVRDDDFILGLCSDCARIVFLIGGSTSGCFRWNLELQDFVAGAVFGEVGGWLDWLCALEMTFHMWRRSSTTFILRGRRSIWWVCRETLPAPRIGNDVSYVTQIIADLHFAWQAQYLVRLPGDFTFSAHWKWSFIVTQIIDDVHFAWQAQYLVRLEGDFTCSTHCKWRFVVVPE